MAEIKINPETLSTSSEIPVNPKKRKRSTYEDVVGQYIRYSKEDVMDFLKVQGNLLKYFMFVAVECKSDTQTYFQFKQNLFFLEKCIHFLAGRFPPGGEYNGTWLVENEYDPFEQFLIEKYKIDC